MKVITFIMLLFAATAQGQVISSDTTPVWVVYLDSVRVFAAYPGVDMRTEVAAGWRVFSVKKEGLEFYNVEQYFDTSGIEFDPDMVLFAKRRKITPNAFRQ